eukprot:3111727-Prymnesium_polylepis.1
MALPEFTRFAMSLGAWGVHVPDPAAAYDSIDQLRDLDWRRTGARAGLLQANLVCTDTNAGILRSSLDDPIGFAAL